MSQVLWAVFLPFLLRLSAAAAPLYSGDFSRAFDGSGEIRLSDAVQQAPAPSGGPVKPPPDLREARDVWGNEAQLAKLSPPGETFTVAVIGDAEPGRAWDRIWGPGKAAYPRQLRSIHDQGPDFIIQLGDLVSDGTAKNYRAYLKILEKYVTLPILHLVGNHDRTGEDKSFWRAVFGERADFFFDRGGYRFVVLDSADYRVTGPQLDWLDEALDTPLRALVFTHMAPSYLKGRLRSQAVGGESEKIGPKGFFGEGSGRFGEIMGRRKPARVYFGHIHAFATADHEGVRYVLTGGGGSPLYPLPPGYPARRKGHYILLRLDPQGLKETVHELGGGTFPVP